MLIVPAESEQNGEQNLLNCRALSAGASYSKLKKATVNALPSCFFFEMIYGTHVFDFSLNISFLLLQKSSVFSSLYFFDMQSCLTAFYSRLKKSSCSSAVLYYYSSKS